jgi:hypothetical protein
VSDEYTPVRRVADVDATVIWRTGEVVRTDRFGRTFARPGVKPLPTQPNPIQPEILQEVVL